MGCSVASEIKDSIAPKRTNTDEALLFEGKNDGLLNTNMIIDKVLPHSKSTEVILQAVKEANSDEEAS
jgi:hypothetical protein